MTIILFFVLIVLACFSVVLLFGAPYLPTLKDQQKQALELLELKPGQTLIELGCGDGRMLVSGAKQGINGVGYELNPIVYVIALIVTFKYRNMVTLKYGNFWHKNWPNADGIYVFLQTRFMSRLDKKITQQFASKNVKVVSYAFTIPGKKTVKERGALFLYKY